MSFSSEAAKVRANIAAGAYKEKVDPFKGFFEELSYGIRERDKEKRAEEIQKRREARAEARRVREAQAAEDRKAKARERLVNGWLTANGQNDVSAENRAEIFNMVTNLGISDYGTLDALMKQNSTYTAGTAQSEIDAQMDALGQLRQGDGPFEAETQRINNLSSEGKIEFGKSRGRNVLEMGIDEVRFELSSPTLTQERREELERRLASFGGSDYIRPDMFHPDGRKATPRDAKEEQALRDQGFDVIQPADPVDFEKRTVYRDGAKLPIYSEADLKQAVSTGWSEVEPAEPEEFKPFDMFAADGRKIVIRNQDMLDEYSKEGSEFGFVQPAPDKSYSRTLYKDGSEWTVKSKAEEQEAINDDWSVIKPADKPDYVKQTLYLNGSEVEATTQEQFNKYTEDGYSPVKPANHGQMLTAKQAALQSFMEEEGVTNLQGEDYRNKLAEFERKWEEQSKAVKEKQESYTTANYTADLIKFGSMAISDNEADRIEASEWFNTTKPIIEGSLNTVAGMDDAAKVAALVESGIDQQRAVAIINGTLKVTTDFSGRPIVVDIASNTSDQITSEGQEGSEQPVSADLDALLTQLNPNWKEQGLSMVVNGEQMTFSPQQIQNNESFKVTADSLKGLDGAFGISGVFNKLAGKAGDLVGAELRAEQNKAITFMSNLRLNTLINLAAAQAGGLRDSVWNKQQIITTLPEPARLFQGPFEERRETQNTLRSIQTSLRLIEKAKASGTITKSDLSRSTITEAALRELERTYLTVLEAFDEALGKAPTGQSSYIKKK